MSFNKNDYRKQLKEEDKKYKALQKVKKENEKKRLKKQRNIFLKLKEKQKENEAEQEELEEKKEERKQRRKNLLDKGIASAKDVSKKFKKNIKKAKKGKVAKIVAKFLIPGGLVSFTLLLVFFVMFTIYAGGIVGTIAGLANPQQRALLEAKGLLGNKEVTTIPSYLIGDEPDLKGSGGSLFGNNISNSGDLGDLTIKDSDPIDLIAYKAALQVQQKDQIQGKFALAQMFFESGAQLNSPLVKNGKNLAGLSWPGRKPIPPGTTKGSEHAEGDGSYLYFDHYQHFADEYVTWLHQDIPDGASVKSPTQFATILKSKHYFTDSLSKYVNGVCALADKKWAEMQQKYGNLKGNSNGGNNNNSSGGDGGNSINSLPASAKWIMQRESSGNIHATNGKYYGLFQLDKSYYPKLCGKSYDQTNAADQIKAATAYMKQRYGSWDKAQAFWQANGWW